MNPAEPPAGTVLCRLDEIADPGTRCFQFRFGEALFAGFVIRRGELIAGYVDSCPHAGWRMAASESRYLTREADYILCSGHGALFKLEDGLCVAGPCAGRGLQSWPVGVEDGWVRLT